MCKAARRFQRGKQNSRAGLLLTRAVRLRGFAAMSLSIVGLRLVAVVGLYFYTNPLKHGRWFMFQRFINWFPLGMTYSFLYMGRTNLAVSKTALGTLMSKEDFGLIFAAGTVTYALSFLVNGPLVEKIGGKKGIMIAAVALAP
jgi:OPA family glycerol-3-phosphate transporter-like MFS transporter